MAAELRLNVGLDLAYFKSQLPKLARAAAGFQLPIKVRIDGKQLQKELNRITGRRQYRINLNDTSVKSAIANVKTLKRELEGLQSKSQKATAAAAPIGTKQLSKSRSKGGVNLDELQALYQQAAIQGIAGFEKGIKIKRDDAVRELAALSTDAIKGLIVGLKQGRGSVEDAAAGLADALVDSMEDRLGIRSPSFRLMKTGEFAAEGFEIGLTKGLQEAERSAVARMQAMLRALQGEAAKFGPALLMASGMGGGRGGDVRSAALMAGGMAGLFSPETEMQRERRQINERIAGRYGSSPTASFQGGASAGRFSFSAQPKVAGLLGPAGSAQASREAARALRILKAEARSAARSASIFADDAARAAERTRRTGASGQVPLGRGGFAGLPPAGGTGGGRGGGGGGGFNPFSGGVPLGPLNLPGAGAIREIGGEFANATKQVLLFGTAYKGLAFLMDFPAQVGSAVAALQSFNNTLGAITPNAEAAGEANQFILDVVDKYNVPLQSARDGFTKLYASMSPAGFSGEDIEELFLGVSQAAATFGMSADKVDRVNYAFAQMASKGQIMSEELKGQLGDVLPGAMGIFAEAAGLEGPDAIQQFSKALEDGAYKGENMNKLLKNVAIILQEEFGPGAEGAARTFQGLTNRMRTSMKLLYEAFEPLAVDFLNGVVVPMTKGIKTLTDGFTAFFTQTKAKTKDGAAFAGVLEDLRPTFEGLKTNVEELLKTLTPMLGVLAEAGKLLLQIAGNPIVGYLAKLLAIALPLNAAFRAFNIVIATVKARLLVLKGAIAVNNAAALTGRARFNAYKDAIKLTGGASVGAAAKIKSLGIAIKAAIGATVVGGIVLGLSFLIEKLISLGQHMDAVREKAANAAQEIRSMGMTEAVMKERETRAALSVLDTLEQRGGRYESADGSEVRTRVSKQEIKTLEKAGIPVQRTIFGEGNIMGSDIESLRQQQQGILAEATYRQRVIKHEDEQSRERSKLSTVDNSGGTEDGGKIKASSEAVLRIRKELLAIQEKLAMGEEGVNQLTLMKKELELELQKISEEEISAQDKEQKKAEARHKHRVKVAKFTAENAKQIIDDLKKQAENRKKIDEILLKQKLASGEMSQKEYDIAMHLRDQLATRQQLKDLGATEAQLREFDNNQGPAPGTYDALLQTAESDLESLIDPVQQLDTIATGVGDTFATMFTDLATGASTAQEALGNMFSNLSDMFANMVQEIIAQWLKVQLIQGLGSIFGGMMGGGAAPTQQSAAQAAGWPTARPYANGGIAYGGFTAFANGGVVKGPTLGLVGEGRHNEAIVPLPNGKSIPVEMGKGMGGDVNSSVVVNINNSGNTQSSTKGSQGNQLAKGIEGAVKDVIMREMRPGGMIASRK